MIKHKRKERGKINKYPIVLCNKCLHMSHLYYILNNKKGMSRDLCVLITGAALNSYNQTVFTLLGTVLLFYQKYRQVSMSSLTLRTCHLVGCRLLESQLVWK